MVWTEEHKPDSFADIKGQSEAVGKVMNFINNFKTQRKKAVLLHGPPGIGKTALSVVAAKETDSELFELNASDLRSKKKLQETLKPAIEQRSLTRDKKLILVDEVDGIFGTDYGGVSELVRLIENTSYPFILTGNNIYTKKLSKLRKKCEIIELNPIDYHTIKDILIQILRKENKFIDNKILTDISIKSKGDLRAAINSLESIVHMKEPNDPSKVNRKKSIFNVLKEVFNSKPKNELLGIYDSVEMPLDEIILWVEKNIPQEYKGEELARAMDLLSKVDLFKGRIYKKQYWRFMVYENIFLSYGMASAKKDKTQKFVKYEKPTRILKMWMNNQKHAKKKPIAQKYAMLTHTSMKTAMRDFALLKIIINSNPQIQKELRLTRDELDYLKK